VLFHQPGEAPIFATTPRNAQRLAGLWRFRIARLAARLPVRLSYLNQQKRRNHHSQTLLSSGPPTGHGAAGGHLRQGLSTAAAASRITATPALPPAHLSGHSAQPHPAPGLAGMQVSMTCRPDQQQIDHGAYCVVPRCSSLTRGCEVARVGSGPPPSQDPHTMHRATLWPRTDTHQSGTAHPPAFSMKACHSKPFSTSRGFSLRTAYKWLLQVSRQAASGTGGSNGVVRRQPSGRTLDPQVNSSRL